MDLYLRNALDCSRITTKNYSTSFASGIRMLHRRYHAPVYAIYGFVRYADEIVDTFFDQDQEVLFQRFSAETEAAIRMGFSTNPILHSFQWVVNTWQVDPSLIEAFLQSMGMDLNLKSYDRSRFTEYIFGSAEVVGLMCLKIFCDGNEKEYQMLTPAARRLGEAFQKVNFLRDLRSDFADRGRSYFPGLDPKAFNASVKKGIETEIAGDFREALKGIRMLDKGARLGVYLTYAYYLKLFKKIRRTPAEELLARRIRISNGRKALILVCTYLKNSLGIIR